MPIWLLGICVFIFNDFLGYWVHRLFHTRWLWRFHSVHHSSTVLDWTSNFRNHPINDLLQSLLQIFILIVCGLPTYMLGWMLYAMAFYDAFLHENIQIGYGPLNKVFVSPSFHRAHHHRLPNGEYGYNFSPYFSFWDIIFKTANFSIKTNPIYGITNEVSKTKDSQAKIS
jgi:sterol desaturase/sphingolipid hydroxylase (fatty acid hydroxylase superfamily)